jgi:hypothetical protein
MIYYDGGCPPLVTYHFGCEVVLDNVVSTASQPSHCLFFHGVDDFRISLPSAIDMVVVRLYAISASLHKIIV